MVIRGHIFKNFEELQLEDPPAVLCLGPSPVDYLERPTGGWIKTSCGFIGIGYYGNEEGEFEHGWIAYKSGYGHIPPKGYG